VIQHPDRLKAEILRRIDSGESQKNALESFDKQIADADRFLVNVARNTAHIDDPEEAAPFVAQAKEYTEQKKNAIEAREAMRASIADRERVEAQLRDFALWCEVFKGHPEIWTYERKRVALYALEIEVRANPYGSDEPFSIEAGPKSDAGERAIILLLPDADSVQTQKYVLRGGAAAIARQ
jgi:hypothetical protein